MFTVNADQVEKEVLAKVPNEFKGAVERVVLAGMKVLFSKETHNQLFDAIRPQDEVPLEDELGGGAANLMLMLYSESKQSMPLQAIIPAGSILLAKACQFIAETKMAEVTDDTYGDALEMFVTVMYDKFDPDFRKRAQGSQAVQTPARKGGLLNQGA